MKKKVSFMGALLLSISLLLAGSGINRTFAANMDVSVVPMPTTNVKQAKASTEGSKAIKAFDGSGLDADGVTHSTAGADGWRTSNGTNIAPQSYKYVAVQFNTAIDLVKMHIWNLNFMNGTTSCTNRGFKDIEIWVSSSASDTVLTHQCGDASGVWTKAIATTLSQATGASDYAGEDVVLATTQKDVQWVMFLCVTNHGASAGYCGLSEVQFFMEKNTAADPIITYDTTMYVAGNFTSEGTEMKELPYTQNFTAGYALSLKLASVITKYSDGAVVQIDTTWYGQTGKDHMTRDNSTWMLTGTEDVLLTTDLEGYYTFSVNAAGAFSVEWPYDLMPTTNVAGAYSSGKPASGREPINVFNGAGLTDKGDGTYTHATSVNGMWATANETDNSIQACKQWIAVKFTKPIKLAKMHIWNLNWNGYTIRGCKDVEVYVSSSTADDLYNTIYNDPSGVWNLAAKLELAQAPASATYTGESFVLDSIQTDVTWVLFRVLTNYNESAATGAHYCGLSEVQFYVVPEHTVTVASNDASMGTVTGGGTFEDGTEITITATPNEGYEFVQWSDGVKETSRTITVTADTTFTAEFRKIIVDYTVTVASNDEAMGAVSGGGTFAEGTEITITATPNEGYEFVQWNDGVKEASRTITVTADATYTAEFRKVIVNFTITVASADASMGTVTGGGTFEDGSEITITATPNEGYEFVQWNDGVTEASRTITVTADATYTAEFRKIIVNFTITVASADASMGTVTGGGTFAEGTEITITATPNEGYEFVQWNDGVTEASRTITVTADATYTAEFRKSDTTNLDNVNADSQMQKIFQDGKIYIINNGIRYSVTGQVVE